MNDSLLALPQLGALLTKYAAVITICSIRLHVLSILFPPFAESGISRMTLNGMFTLLGLYVAYGQLATLIDTLGDMAIVGLFVRETMIGFLLGFAASSVFWVAEGAGVYIDNLTGYNNVQVTNPLSQDQATPTSTLLKQIATTTFWTLGGMTFLLSAVFESYRWWPVTSLEPIPRNILQSFMLSQTDTLMQSTAKLALPIVFVLLLVDIALGFVSKSAEKFELNALGQPLKGTLAVLMLALLTGLFVDQTRHQITLVDLGSQFRHALNR
jgi:type III secretion protein T